jgi:CubicO group peptidase (beta-lactamase class C family)
MGQSTWRGTISILLIGLGFFSAWGQVSEPSTEPFALLLSKNGYIVSKKYAVGRNAQSLCNVQSLTKGLMATLIGMAIDQQLIPSENEPIAYYLKDLYPFSENSSKGAITIAHLMDQTSDLAWQGHIEHQAWLTTSDPIAYVLDKAMAHKPGTFYNYNSGATHLLSVILSQASGMTTLAFAQKHLFGPLGFGTVDWQMRNDGYHDGSGLGLSLLPKDVMAWAQLLENKGMYNGAQLVSEAWLLKMFDPNRKKPTQWGLPNSKHGYCWYTADFKGDHINYGMGYGGQFILLVPEKKLIIVSMHEHDTPNGIPQQLRFLHGKLPPILQKYGD